MTQFTGFPADGLQFLADLETHNNREWFETNKSRFDENLLQPAVAFVEVMGQRLQTILPGLQYDTRTNGSGSLMRIYRDTRFSKDKTPYKTHLDGLFWEGDGKKTLLPAFGFRLQAAGMEIMVGLVAFLREMLTNYREAVDDEQTGIELNNILARIQQDGRYRLGGEQYKRVPQGYAADHPREVLLRFKGLHAHPAQIPADVVRSATLVDVCFEHFQALAPLQQWLVKNLA
ncbi:MAG: DUF2461 domain-containing protein [Anaerolineales bacterium]|nr:DUF2461 domain-containing protein [Anaerolineales bacterium]